MKNVKLFEDFVNEETFYRLPNKIIGNDLYAAKQSLNSFYDSTSSGDDVEPKTLESIIKNLERIQKEVKKFSHSDELEGTDYDSVYYVFKESKKQTK